MICRENSSTWSTLTIKLDTNIRIVIFSISDKSRSTTMLAEVSRSKNEKAPTNTFKSTRKDIELIRFPLLDILIRIRLITTTLTLTHMNNPFIFRPRNQFESALRQDPGCLTNVILLPFSTNILVFINILKLMDTRAYMLIRTSTSRHPRMTISHQSML